MIRFRKISNPYLESNLRQIEKIKEIIRIQFPGISDKKIFDLDGQMTDPIKYKYQSILLIAEDINETVRGFALLLNFSDLQFCYLDYIAVSPNKPTSGIGGALYERIREEALSLDSYGIFYECLPDDPELCFDKSLIPQNRKVLHFMNDTVPDQL